MPDISFSGLVLVCAVAFLAPLLLELAPALRLPSVVLEIVGGIVVGPSVLGWVSVDSSIAFLSLMGVAFLLLLAGLEVEFDKLRGRRLAVTGGGFALSFGLALLFSATLAGAGQVEAPLLVAIILSATSLGVIVPLLKDRGELSSEFGQLVITAASIADFATIILLSLFFSREATGAGTRLVLLGGLVLFAAVVVLAGARAGRSMWVSAALVRLQDTSAQIRVRGAFLILVGFAALAGTLGVEVILGTFVAGAVLRLLDRDEMMTHPQFRAKLDAIAFGVFAPFFFITSGLRFNLDALLSDASTIARVPVFLALLLAVRGLPALLYRGQVSGRQMAAAGLLQATSLGFIVVASQIGMELGKLDEGTGAALIAAGLLSVLLFPPIAGALLRAEAASPELQTAPSERTRTVFTGM